VSIGAPGFDGDSSSNTTGANKGESSVHVVLSSVGIGVAGFALVVGELVILVVLVVDGIGEGFIVVDNPVGAAVSSKAVGTVEAEVGFTSVVVINDGIGEGAKVDSPSAGVVVVVVIVVRASVTVVVVVRASVTAAAVVIVVVRASVDVVVIVGATVTLG